MNSKIYVLTLCILLTVLSYQIGYCSRLDVTNQLEHIGTPYEKIYHSKSSTYARNIWDMFSYRGKLYMGAGNSSNGGPATNAGPVPVVVYDPGLKSFFSEFTVDEEQIDTFYEFDGRLYIPGHDSTGNWSFGNLYNYSTDEGWRKLSTVPNAIHIYSLTQYRQRLFAALGTKNKQSVAITEDCGKSWRQIYLGMERIYNFLHVNNKLYAIGTIYSDAFIARNSKFPHFVKLAVSEFIPPTSFGPREDLSWFNTFFPDTEVGKFNRLKITRPIKYGTKSIYIGAEVHNDHQSLPFGAYIAASLDEKNVSVSRIPLPPGTVPWDISCVGNNVYILLESKGSKGTEVTVMYSNNAKDWQEMLFFRSTTFARSFAILDNYVYISLGDEFYDISSWEEKIFNESTGKLVRVKIPQGNP